MAYKKIYFIASKVLLTSSVKNFVRRAHFCFFKQTFKRKNFSAKIQKFSANIKEIKRLAYKTFYATCQRGLSFLRSLRFCQVIVR